VKVGLIDVDRTGFPNVALMKLSAWHKAQGHETVLVRDDRWLLHAAQCDRLYASCVFTWNREKAEGIAALGAEVGGTGVSLKVELPREVEAMRPDYSLYGIDYGVGYLMRGCIWTCDFCIVPQKEGKPREVATIDDLLNRDSDRRRPFVVLLDNEFFWREKWAIARLYEFTERGIDWCPSQGLDVRVLTPPLCAALAASPFWNVSHSRRQITFAFDDIATTARFRRGVEMLFAAGIKGWQLQSFVLVGFNSTIEQDQQRLAVIREYGIDPFVMVYRDFRTGQAPRDPELRKLARWVNRHLYRVIPFSEYRSHYRSWQASESSANSEVQEASCE
jgi:hypothetical protein